MISKVKVISPCNSWNKGEIQNHGIFGKTMGSSKPWENKK
jgi:hypothetical protein